jgi:hypothetical protein
MKDSNLLIMRLKRENLHTLIMRSTKNSNLLITRLKRKTTCTYHEIDEKLEHTYREIKEKTYMHLSHEIKGKQQTIIARLEKITDQLSSYNQNLDPSILKQVLVFSFVFLSNTSMQNSCPDKCETEILKGGYSILSLLFFSLIFHMIFSSVINVAKETAHLQSHPLIFLYMYI